MSNKPHMDALDMQVDLIKSWSTPMGARFAAGFETSLHTQGTTHLGAYRDLSLADWQRQQLDRAETYWCSSEMLSVTEAAAKTMPDEGLLLTDLPTTSGFVVFERSGHFIDRRDKRLSFKAISWWVTSRPYTKAEGAHPEFEGSIDGVELSYYTDSLEDDDDQNRQFGPDRTRLLPRLTLVHTGFWPFDWTAEMVLPEWEEGVSREAFDDSMRMLLWHKAFWRLIQQKIARVERRPPDRGARRRAVRGGFLADVQEVRVIRLRKYAEPQPEFDREPGEGDEVMWSHRWIVDGHWRNQWYPSLNMHRNIWISPFIKGPEDRPLIVKDKVYVVNR